MFLIVSVLLVVLVRPALRRRLTPAAGPQMGIKALEGKNALVLDRVTRDEGQVKLDGQVWTARPLNEGDVYEPGESVTVMHIDGATAVVFRNSLSPLGAMRRNDARRCACWSVAFCLSW